MGKTKLIISIVIVLIVIGAAFFFFVPEKAAAAILYVEEGTVEINTGSGWNPASDEMKLKENAEVRTAEGRATVVLYDSEIIRLEPNTHIKLKDLNKENIVVGQESGATWNKVMKMTGTTGYDVETPNTVATVRGTEFGVLVAEELSEVFVEEGNLGLKQKEDNEVVGEIALAKGEMVAVQKGVRELVKAQLKEKHLEMVKRNKADDLKTLRQIRKNIVIRNKLAKIGMKIKKFTEKNLDDSLDDIDSGRSEREEANKLIDKIPGYAKEKERFKELNQKIREKVQAGDVPQELRDRLAAVKQRTEEEIREREELKEKVGEILEQREQVRDKIEETAEKLRETPDKLREELSREQQETGAQETADQEIVMDENRDGIQIQRAPLR
ncbi:FecR domain-containing protein [Candidatus Woesearchaeota archaeon]|nr:FecR domain-containing protein [Candidatus Woesearchaeota archaeon]